MSIPNAIRDDNNSYFLKEDIDVTAWLSKIIADVPHQAFMYQMKAFLVDLRQIHLFHTTNKLGG
ncbi:hypothetical protein M422DRAFT_242722 [Sphaerobolus stellatus SS14]|nr:hypothetical protein M422DRAFT_242722 [Sphaerobolus stellatus SS14]